MPSVLTLIGAAVLGIVAGVSWSRRSRSGPGRKSPSRDERGSGDPEKGHQIAGSTPLVPTEAESHALALIERATIGIFRATMDNRLLDVNPALVRMLGFPDGDVLRRVDFARDILWDEDERSRWSDDLALDRLSEWKEMSWRRFDGSQVRTRVSAHIVLDASGQATCCEGFVEDISQRVRRDEIMRRAERMTSLSRTLAGVAHEINNPLAAIIGFTQIQLRGSPPTADRLALETVLGEARRAARIVKDLLTIARREESIHRQPVSLNEAVSYILSTQRYAIETRGIRVEFIASPTPVVVRGDPTQLEQVFLNLLVNARQALETRSERVRREPRPHGSDWTPFISVRTGIIGDHARVEIADNGDGISAADLPHIWDPFWTKREEGEGSGLGLSVVHGIVTSHGGAIDVKSDEGQGTVLTIFLPRELEPAAQLQERPSVNLRDRDPVPRPLDILVVDDEAVLLDLLRRIFSSRGHAVVVAMDGLQAIRLAEQSTFDVVVCDLRMPGMDGRDVIDRLAQLPTCARTRFVLSTGDASSSADLFAPGSRVDAIVSKPYSVDTLLEVVERNTAP